MDLKQRAKQVTAESPAVFMALQDRDTPWPANRMAGITAAYALSPIDLMPDFIPVREYLDDVLVRSCQRAA